MASRQNISLPTPPLPAGASPGPPTARHEGVTTLCDAFMRASRDQYFIDLLVEEMVENACCIHVDRVLGDVAVEYTACALWAEMVHLVSSSVAPVDEGYRSTAELAVSEGSRVISEHHHDPWRPDAPPSRIITEEHSRRVVDLRPAKVESLVTNGRRRRDQSRPSSQSSMQIDDTQARSLLSRGSLKPGSRGSIDLSVTQTLRVSAAQGALQHKLSPRLHHAKNADKSNGLDVSQTSSQTGTMAQPDYVTDETEVKQHQESLAQIAADRDESQRKAARIAKTLSDPKTAPKNFTIDKMGNVISLLHVDDSRVAAQCESLSPRFMIPQQPAPPPPPEVTIVNPKGRARVNVTAKAERDDKKRSPREGKREEGFISTDARDVPMQIKVVPSGGVTVKESNMPQRTAELKTPSTKLSRQEFLRLRGTLVPSDTPQAFAEQTAPRVDGGVTEDHKQEANAEAALPVKRPLPAPKSNSKAETARKSQLSVTPQAGMNPASARTLQAPAPPPKRDVLPNRAVNTRKMQIEKCAPTKQIDKQLATLADTWQGQRVMNEERTATRVTVAQQFDNDDDFTSTM